METSSSRENHQPYSKSYMEAREPEIASPEIVSHRKAHVRAELHDRSKFEVNSCLRIDNLPAAVRTRGGRIVGSALGVGEGAPLVTRPDAQPGVHFAVAQRVPEDFEPDLAVRR